MEGPEIRGPGLLRDHRHFGLRRVGLHRHREDRGTAHHQISEELVHFAEGCQEHLQTLPLEPDHRQHHFGRE